jgi:small-conductance mechanosensitive channel
MPVTSLQPLFVIFAWLALGGAAMAQTPPTPVDPAVSAQVQNAQAVIHAAAPGRHAAGLSDAEIKAKLATLPPVQSALTSVLAGLTPRLQDIQTRLAQLGPPPAPGQPPESPQTAASRAALNREHEALDSEVKLARLLALEANQTSAALVAQLHRNFEARLWTRSRSILDPSLWRDLVTSLPDDTASLSRTAWDESERFNDAVARRGVPVLLALSLLAGLLIIGPARFILNRLGYRRASAAATATRLRRSSLALWLVGVAVITPIAGGLILRGALLGAAAATEGFDAIVVLTIRAVSYATLLEGLGRALLSPGRPSWRLAPVSEDAVARIAPYPGLLGAAAGLTGLVTGVNAVIGSSLATSVASDCVTVLLEFGVAGAALLAMARVRGERLVKPADHKAEQESRLPWIVAALGAWLSLGATLVAVLAGYLALASFLMRETIWVGVVLSLVFLVIRFTDDLFPAVLSNKTASGRMMRNAIGLTSSALDQIAVLASGLARLAILLLGWFALLLPFGAGLSDVLALSGHVQFVLRIGQVTISPIAVLGGVGLFFIGLLATRAVRGWLETRYLPKTRMDVGVRTSVATGVSYLGAVIAAVLAFAYLGLSFTQIAIFASALSVGIGFGLQAIIGNFVSGLILLAERPVKVGDWIAIGELEGDVKAINIRATEIEMADRSRLIVPNSDLVSKTVRNVTHAGAIGRVRIVLKVADSAAPEAVREVILTRLTGHADVQADPPPAVYLTDVRDGALEFTAYAYVKSPRQAFRVKSELLFQIVPDLGAHGIALASSNAIVNVGLADRPIEPVAAPKST